MHKLYKITNDDLLKIISSPDLEILTKSVWCPDCGNSKIINYKNNIVVDDLYDTILTGKCSKCGNSVSRHIETGENDDKVELLKEIIFEK